MKKIYLQIVVGLIVLIAVITNPNQERHKEAVKNKLNSYMQKAMKENLTGNNDLQQAGQALGMMLGGAFIDRMIDNLVSADNYVLFSLTKITWDGQTKVVGVGVFGNVFFSSKLDELVDKGLLKN